jgi:dTDP-4-dehydrorhamnose 3,5-epimerase
VESLVTAAGAPMIDGAGVYPLRQIPDERGKIMHMLRVDDPHFERFGEIYFSMIYPGIIKGWHRHSVVTLNYAVLIGTIKLVMFDDRAGSPTRGRVVELFPGESQYLLVRIPPGVWNGYKGIGTAPALVANCATHPHDPTEMERLDPFDNHIPYDWSVQHR